HDYELYLAVEDVDHSRTKTKSPQTNGICERFHRTVLDEFYRIAFRKKIYRTLDELQADLDAWLVEYNYRRPHQGRWCFGKTPMQTFLGRGESRERRRRVQAGVAGSAKEATGAMDGPVATRPAPPPLGPPSLPLPKP